MLHMGPPGSLSQTASRSVQPFLPSSRQIVAMLYNGPSLFPPPLKLPIPMEDLDPIIIIHGFWAHPSPQPKRHLDRFNRFCRAYYCSRQTDDATRCNNRAHLKVRSTAMGPNNIYILNAVRCPSRTYVRNGRRGQL